MEALAKQLVAIYAGRVRLGRCSWDSFPDSTPSIQIEPADCIQMDTEDHDVAFLASFADPKLIFEQLAARAPLPCDRALLLDRHDGAGREAGAGGDGGHHGAHPERRAELPRL